MAGTADSLGDRVPAGRGDALNITFSENDPSAVLSKIGPLARMVGATLTNTSNPTMLAAGYKVNVVPQTASAQIDGRFLPGYQDEFLAEIDDLIGPAVRREFVNNAIALETTFDGDLVRRDGPGAERHRPGRQGRSLLPVRRHRRQVVQQAGDPLLRVHPAAAAGRPRLLRACSTGWTSGFQSTRWNSAPRCSTASSTCADTADPWPAH